MASSPRRREQALSRARRPPSRSSRRHANYFPPRFPPTLHCSIASSSSLCAALLSLEVCAGQEDADVDARPGAHVRLHRCPGPVVRARARARAPRHVLLATTKEGSASNGLPRPVATTPRANEWAAAGRALVPRAASRHLARRRDDHGVAPRRAVRRFGIAPSMSDFIFAGTSTSTRRRRIARASGTPPRSRCRRGCPR
jgi:hypothetical protein